LAQASRPPRLPSRCCARPEAAGCPKEARMIHHPGGPAMASPVVAMAAAPAPMATTTIGARVSGQSAVISSFPGQQFTTYANPLASQTLTAAAAPSQTLTAINAAQPQPQPQPQPQTHSSTATARGAVQMPTGIALQSASMNPPATPKIQAAGAGVAAATASGTSPAAAVRAASPQGVVGQQQSLSREQTLEQRVRELEQLLGQKDAQIKDLQAALSKAGASKASPGTSGGASGAGGTGAAGQPPARSPGRAGNNGSGGLRKPSGARPSARYTAADQDCQIDVRLEEWYNTTGSAVPFRRINRGFYRFGDTIAELDVINHKLMVRTEDGWNRGKFGPIEKFMMYYENIEREKAGIQPEA